MSTLLLILGILAAVIVWMIIQAIATAAGILFALTILVPTERTRECHLGTSTGPPKSATLPAPR